MYSFYLHINKNSSSLIILTPNNFAVNLITIAPNYKEHLAMLKDNPVKYIVFAGSFPKEKEVEAAKATGAKVLCFASTVSIAERMIRFGADAIVLEGSEAISVPLPNVAPSSVNNTTSSKQVTINNLRNII